MLLPSLLRLPWMLQQVHLLPEMRLQHLDPTRCIPLHKKFGGTSERPLDPIGKEKRHLLFFGEIDSKPNIRERSGIRGCLDAGAGRLVVLP